MLAVAGCRGIIRRLRPRKADHSGPAAKAGPLRVTETREHAIHHHRPVYRNEGHRLRRRVPGGLHSPAQGRTRVRGGDDALHPSGRVHRLRRLRAGVPRGGDLREHRRDPVAPERSGRSQRGLPARRCRHDGQGRSDRRGSRRGAAGADGHPGRRTPGRARFSLTLALSALGFQLSDALSCLSDS